MSHELSWLICIISFEAIIIGIVGTFIKDRTIRSIFLLITTVLLSTLTFWIMWISKKCYKYIPFIIILIIKDGMEVYDNIKETKKRSNL